MGTQQTRLTDPLLLMMMKILCVLALAAVCTAATTIPDHETAYVVDEIPDETSFLEAVGAFPCQRCHALKRHVMRRAASMRSHVSKSMAQFHKHQAHVIKKHKEKWSRCKAHMKKCNGDCNKFKQRMMKRMASIEKKNRKHPHIKAGKSFIKKLRGEVMKNVKFVRSYLKKHKSQ